MRRSIVGPMAGARHVVLLNATPDESDMYAWWLESCGYRVSVVPDLDAVCRVATDDIVDVLVVDGVFGRRERALQLAEPLRRLSRQFGIVVLAGYLSDWSWNEPLSGHMYLLKPCLPEQLSEALSRVVGVDPESR